MRERLGIARGRCIFKTIVAGHRRISFNDTKSIIVMKM